MVDLQEGENENYAWHRATIRSQRTAITGHAGAGKALLQGQPAGHFGSRHAERPNEDLYLNFGGMSDDNQRAVIQAYVFPLVSWIWIGGLVLIGGTLVCLVPSKVKLQYARTEVVGVQKHALFKVKRTRRERPRNWSSALSPGSVRCVFLALVLARSGAWPRRPPRSPM